MSPVTVPIWIVILVAVSAMASVTGRPRGYAFAACGAASWVVIALIAGASADSAGFINYAWAMAGGAAILAAGLLFANPRGAGSETVCQSGSEAETAPPAANPAVSPGEIANRFDAWLTDHGNRPDPWPDFGEFITNTLFQTYNAKHVRAYRLLTTDDDVLFPVRFVETEHRDFPSARLGIVGHVVTTGKSYYTNDPAQGDFVAELAAQAPGGAAKCEWCFAIRRENRSIGVVSVGEADPQRLLDRTQTQLVEGLISLCWVVLAESCRSRLADETDPVSGALTHTAFTHAAGRAIATAYEQGEPIAIANVSIEGLRWYADNGQWDFAKQTLYEICSLLKQRLRDEDEVGVFDGSRFLILLRRVDSALAMLIVQKLLDCVAELCTKRGNGETILRARCGIAGSGLSRPGLHTLISRATDLCIQARINGSDLAADLDCAEEVGQP